MTKTHQRAAWASSTALLAGIAASLAGNLQAINLANARPGIGAYVSAVIWPLFLFGAIEVMLHTPWLASRRDAWTKWTGLLGVAMVAAWVSYWHMAHVLAAYGYDRFAGHLGPLAVDGMMAMATLALNRVGQARRAAADVHAQPVPAPAPAYVATEADVAESEAAMRGWTGQDAHWLDRIGAELGTDVDQPTSPAPRSYEVRPESVPADAVDLIMAWDQAPLAERPRPGQADQLVAGALGVKPRTARRWRYAVTVGEDLN